MALSDRGKAILSTLLVVIFILVLVLAAEGLTRVRQYFKYGAFGTLLALEIDPDTGLRIPIAGFKTAHISINSLGFRGPEIDLPKPENRLRIGFLGASTTYCAEVSDNDHVWTELVRKRLESARPGLSVDTINGGVPGYTTGDSLVNLKRRVAPLGPDVIVIYHGSNDLAGETRALALAAGIEHANLATQESWLESHSLLWGLVKKNLAVMDVEKKASETLPLDASTLGAAFRQNLIDLVNTAREMGAKHVALATFSIHLRPGMSPEQRNTAMVSARFYMPYLTADSLLAGFQRYNEIIREVAKETGAALIGGENSIPGDPTHFVDSVHFSDQGSQRQAERITSGLLASPTFLRTLSRYEHP